MAELGNKHECLSCESKFYDLGRSEIICPKCGANQKELAEETGAKEAAGSTARAPAIASEPAAAQPVDLKKEEDSVEADKDKDDGK